MSIEPPAIHDPTPLRIDALGKRFGDFVAVDDVSLTVAPGEIFALLGPNGAGKTTLISCIAGLTRQSSGTISVFGYDTVADYRITRRLVGLVPQEINFDPFFTPLESLEIHMGLMGVRPDRAWAEELLRTMSLWSHRNAYTRNLSGGMKRRLLVAKALVHRPRLLFLDEPTAGVDVELRKDLWREVGRLRDNGTTVILTTHYLEEAEELADRIGVIHHGQLLLVEPRDKLMSRHRQGSVKLQLARPLEALPEGLPESAVLCDPTTIAARWSTPVELERILHVVNTRVGVEDAHVEQTRLEDIFVDLIRRAESGGRP